jgi:uncharacterized protein DUF5985
MAGVFYALCAVTACLCAMLQLRAYFRARYRLLLWGGLCFVGLGLNNALLVIDKLMLPDVDLFAARLIIALAAHLVLLYGLIWDAE